jgi:hypothetical protein
MLKFDELWPKQSIRDAEDRCLVLFLWTICQCVGLCQDLFAFHLLANLSPLGQRETLTFILFIIFFVTDLSVSLRLSLDKLSLVPSL